MLLPSFSTVAQNVDLLGFGGFTLTLTSQTHTYSLTRWAFNLEKCCLM